MDRVLVYTCCDENYADFIPLFIDSILFFNENVDVEIGVTSSCLPKNTEDAIKIIKEKHPNSKILVKINFGKSISQRVAFFDGKEMFKNTIRFVSTPEIKDAYVYISDIDIITLKENCFQQYLDDMAKNHRDYSNIIRKNDPSHMSGLHFTKWDAFYPLDLTGINLKINDEQILKKIVAKKNKIDEKTQFRPVNGIHMSPNRRPTDKVGWELTDDKKPLWKKYFTSSEFKAIYPLLSSRLKANIKLINSFYKIKEHSMGQKELKLPLPPSKNKFVVYTCITGGYDGLLEPKVVPDNVDFVCFTDDETLTSEKWKVYPIPSELENYSNVKKQRLVKILPHKWLPNYEESLWIDGNMEVMDDVNKFVQKLKLQDKVVSIGKHPQRNCIYDEEQAVVKAHKDKKEITEPQIKRYKEEGFPKHYGLAETCIIYRKHNNPTCIKIMEAWAEELKNGSHRDQLSLNYVLWKLNETIDAFPAKEYNKGIIQLRLGHRKNRKSSSYTLGHLYTYKKHMVPRQKAARVILNRPITRALQLKRINLRTL